MQLQNQIQKQLVLVKSIVETYEKYENLVISGYEDTFTQGANYGDFYIGDVTYPHAKVHSKTYFNMILDNYKEYFHVLKKVKKLVIKSESKISQHLENLLHSSLNIYVEEMSSDRISYDLFNRVNYLLNVDGLEAFLQLSVFGAVENNIILIGGNGSGKSSYSEKFKGSDNQLISLIPAQKSLYFEQASHQFMNLSKKQLASELSTYTNLNNEHNPHLVMEYINNNFTKLINAMLTDNHSYLLECQQNGNQIGDGVTIYSKVQSIFPKIFKGLNIEIPQNLESKIVAVKNEERFDINRMSDGEKSALYYILCVLTASEGGIIIVDEPETFLNPSIVNLLWDELIAFRYDCQFIFISHSVDFVLGRQDTTIAWIQKFTHPDKWNIKILEENNKLPKHLLTEILGSQKRILFCEGDDKSSYDYRVYHGLFSDYFTIIPVGGHDNVEYCTQAINKNDLLGLRAIGIIDYDNFTPEKLEDYRSKSVYTGEINEIEMLLVSEEVMKVAVKHRFPYQGEAPQRIASFIINFWKKFESENESVKLKIVKNEVDKLIFENKIGAKNLDIIDYCLNRITNIKTKDLYQVAETIVDSVIENRNYMELIKVCNLKNSISKNLAEEYFDSNYDSHAVKTICNEPKLQKKIIEIYFPFIKELLD